MLQGQVVGPPRQVVGPLQQVAVLQQVVVGQGQVVGAQHQVTAHPVAPHLQNPKKLLVVFEVTQQLDSL